MRILLLLILVLVVLPLLAWGWLLRSARHFFGTGPRQASGASGTPSRPTPDRRLADAAEDAEFEEMAGPREQPDTSPTPSPNAEQMIQDAEYEEIP